MAAVLGLGIAAAPAQAATSIAYLKYPWSPDIFRSVNGGAATYVTGAQWAAAGRPAPRVVQRIQGQVVFRYVSSPQEIFVDVPGNERPHHKFTYGEWVNASRPDLNQVRQFRFDKLPNSSAVWRVPACPTEGSLHLNYQQWVMAGQPTPEVLREIGECFLRQ